MITTTSFPARDTRTDLTENRLEKPLDRGERETLENCERVIQSGMDTFMEVGGALTVIRDQRLYRASHKTFEEYCREKWDMTGRRARQLCAAAGVVRNLLEERNPEAVQSPKSKVQSPEDDRNGRAQMADGKEPEDELGLFANNGLKLQQAVDRLTKPEPLPKPTSERQVRALSSLPREEQLPTWQDAIDRAEGRKVTARDVEEAVRNRSPKSNVQSPKSDGESRIEKILAEAERTVIQIRRLQDLIDRTDTPMVRYCESAVQSIEALEVKFKQKKQKAESRKQTPEPQKATKRTKISAAARALMSARARARWAKAKAVNSTQRRKDAGTQRNGNGSDKSDQSDGSGETYVITRRNGKSNWYLTLGGGWSMYRDNALEFKSRGAATSTLRGRDGEVVQA